MHAYQQPSSPLLQARPHCSRLLCSCVSNAASLFRRSMKDILKLFKLLSPRSKTKRLTCDKAECRTGGSLSPSLSPAVLVSSSRRYRSRDRQICFTSFNPRRRRPAELSSPASLPLRRELQLSSHRRSRRPRLATLAFTAQ